MSPLGIVVIVVATLIVGGVLGRYIYRKAKHLPTGDCCGCEKKGKGLVDAYHKAYKNENKECCPHCKSEGN